MKDSDIIERLCKLLGLSIKTPYEEIKQAHKEKYGVPIENSIAMLKALKEDLGEHFNDEIIQMTYLKA